MIFVIGLTIGWCLNIWKMATELMAMETITFTGMLVARIIGIFVGPLGGVLGWIG